MIVETVVILRSLGHHVILVSSGAIGTALRLTKRDRRPKHLPEIQALAAIGQCKLMAIWDSLFGHMGVVVGQVLLTRNDIASRSGYQNAQNTLGQLLAMDIVPIVNENDTLSVAEIKFGDNDTLSAITAGMVAADYLFLMTDVDCVYDKNPRIHPDAIPIEVVEDVSALVTDTSGGGSHLGTGGMATKIVAARLATAAGVTTVITRSNKPGNIPAILAHAEAQRVDDASLSSSGELPPQENNEPAPEASTAAARPPNTEPTANNGTAVPLHTRFMPDPHPIRDRYFWILHGLQARGTLYIDQGAAAALASRAGLLPVGIVDVDGSFHQQEAVKIVVVKRLPANQLPPIPIFRPTEDEVLAQNHTPNLTGLSRPTTPSVSTPVPYDKAKGMEIGRALVNYSASEIRRIKGAQSTQISEILGYADNDYVALRENIAFIRTDFRWPLSPGLEHWS